MSTYTSVHVGTKIDKAVSQFDDNGFLLHDPSGEGYVDIDFPFVIRTTGGGRPTLATLIGRITAPRWDIENNLSLEGQELIHGWSQGTPLNWHSHLITNGLDATDRYVNLEIEYSYAVPFGQIQPVSIITTGNVLIPANTPDRTHFIVNIHDFLPADATIATHVYAYLERISPTDGALGPTASPFITMLQLHAKVNSLGSRSIQAK